MTKKLKDKIRDWEVYKRLRENIKPSFIYVILIFIIGISAFIGFRFTPIFSDGGDTTQPLWPSTIDDMRRARDSGADMFKVFYIDQNPSLLAQAINTAQDLGMTLVIRNGRNVDANQYAQEINSAISQSNLVNGRVILSLGHNEPNTNEPIPADIEGEFSRALYNSLSDAAKSKLKLGSPMFDASGAEWMSTYWIAWAESMGTDLNNVDVLLLNNYGELDKKLPLQIEFFKLFFDNPQILNNETGSLYEGASIHMSMDQFAKGLATCNSSPNCIGSIFFNVFLDKGGFGANWPEGTTQEQINALLAANVSSKNLRDVNLSAGFLAYLKDPTSAAGKAFFAQLIKLFGEIDNKFRILGESSKYGITASVYDVTCDTSTGQVSYGFRVNRDDPSVDFRDWGFLDPDKGLGMNYKIQRGGNIVSSGALGGSSIYGNEGGQSQQRPAGSQGVIIDFDKSNTGDSLTHNFTVDGLAPGDKIIFGINLKFGSQYGADNLTNVCYIDVLPNGQCSADIQCDAIALFCAASNNNIKKPPNKPADGYDAEPVTACNAGGDSQLSVSYNKIGVDAGEHYFRLGFEITNAQLFGPLAQNSGPDPMLTGSDYVDNTPPRIVKRLATSNLKTGKPSGYVEAVLGNLTISDNNNRSGTNLGSYSADAGIDYLEYLFENMCYISSSQSNFDLCDEILRFSKSNAKVGTPTPKDPYNGSYNYSLEPEFQNLQEEVLSCNFANNANQHSYTGEKSEDYSAGGSGSYVFGGTDGWTVNVPEIAFGKGNIRVGATTNISLNASRVDWIINSMLSVEQNFQSQLFQSEADFQSYYECVLKEAENYGGAAQVNYRLILEERQELQCSPEQIRIDDYEWKKVSESKEGHSYLPGIGILYSFLSHLPQDFGSTAGLTYRFDPQNPNACALVPAN